MPQAEAGTVFDVLGRQRVEINRADTAYRRGKAAGMIFNRGSFGNEGGKLRQRRRASSKLIEYPIEKRVKPITEIVPKSL